MSITTERSLAIYYEHPDWFRPLFEELDRRGTPYVKLDAATLSYDAGETEAPYSVVFNRMSPSAYLREAGSAIHFTSQYLAHLERLGVRVINGSGAWQTEISKAHQLSLLERLELPYPRARVIHCADAAPDAAHGLRFPIVIKPNIGGSGAGIRRFDSMEELELAVQCQDLDLGIDHTALVQEHIPAEGGRIVRVEVVGGRFLYAIRIYTDGTEFNLCPADVCLDMDGSQLERSACPVDAAENSLRVEGYQPPAEIVFQVEQIIEASGIEIGGVEYMIDDRDGQLYYYDINALSNFVADAPNVVGLDAFAELAGWLEQEVGCAPAFAGTVR